MRISTPRPIVELLKDYVTTPENIFTLNKYKAIDEKGRYLHWDELRRRYSPNAKGQSEAELAWTGIKMSRDSIMNPLKICDYSPSYAVPDSLQALLHFIDTNSGGSVGTNNLAGLSKPEQNRFLLRSLIMEEAITSAQLEGAVTTRKEAKAMLESERKPKTKDEMMILNNYHLMKEAIRLKQSDLSVEMILEFHRIATHNAIENHAISGAFRHDNEIYIADYDGNKVHQPPNFEQLPCLMQSVCDFANTNHNGENAPFIHPVVKAIILHFLIGFIHPFGDGNGRTARALFYWYMLKNGYWLFEYISISRLLKEAPIQYAKAYLYTETDELDMTYFLYYQANIIKRAIISLEQYINDKQQQFKMFSSAIVKFKIGNRLNDRQVQILQKAVKETGATFTAKEISNEFGISENTARKDLNCLLNLKLLGQIKTGNTINYISPNDLLQRLGQSD